MAISIDAPENRVSDGVISLAPFELADTVTVMKWDADPEVQHWYDWPLTPPWNDPETYEAHRANAERVVRGQPAAWNAGEEFAFMIHSAETGEGLGWIDLQPRGQGRGNIAYGVLTGTSARGGRRDQINRPGDPRPVPARRRSGVRDRRDAGLAS